MNCKDVTPLIHAYLDKELDAANAVNIEQHIQHCQSCRQEYEGYQQQQLHLKEHLQRHVAPEGLMSSIVSKLESPVDEKQPNKQALGFKRLGTGIALAASVVLAVFMISVFNHHQAETRLLNEVLAEHVGSIHAEHITDISSKDIRELQPWFARKLDYSPRVYDFSEAGYRILGGRLGSLQNKHIASIAYQHQDHIINLYTWPSPDVDDAEQELHVRNGYHLLYWCQDKMNYWIVSDMNTVEMKKMALLLQQKLRP